MLNSLSTAAAACCWLLLADAPAPPTPGPGFPSCLCLSHRLPVAQGVMVFSKTHSNLAGARGTPERGGVVRCDLRPEVCEMPHGQTHPGLPVEGLVLCNLHHCQAFTSSALWVMRTVTAVVAAYVPIHRVPVPRARKQHCKRYLHRIHPAHPTVPTCLSSNLASRFRPISNPGSHHFPPLPSS